VPDTVGLGVQAADTDYRYEAMTDEFLASASASRNSLVNVRTSAVEAVARDFAQLAEVSKLWLGNHQIQMQFAGGAAAGLLSAGTADSIVGYLKLGAALSNSASPPVPSYQNLGGIPPAQATDPNGSLVGVLNALVAKLNAIATKVGA